MPLARCPLGLNLPVIAMMSPIGKLKARRMLSGTALSRERLGMHRMAVCGGGRIGYLLGPVR